MYFAFYVLLFSILLFSISRFLQQNISSCIVSHSAVRRRDCSFLHSFSRSSFLSIFFPGFSIFINSVLSRLGEVIPAWFSGVVFQFHLFLLSITSPIRSVPAKPNRKEGTFGGFLTISTIAFA